MCGTCTVDEFLFDRLSVTSKWNFAPIIVLPTWLLRHTYRFSDQIQDSEELNIGRKCAIYSIKDYCKILCEIH